MTDLHQRIIELERRITLLEEDVAREQAERQSEERFIDDCIAQIEALEPRQDEQSK